MYELDDGKLRFVAYDISFAFSEDWEATPPDTTVKVTFPPAFEAGAFAGKTLTAYVVAQKLNQRAIVVPMEAPPKFLSSIVPVEWIKS